MREGVYPGLLPDGWRNLAYEPFREGVDVHYLTKAEDGRASVAILRYAPGARVPRHRHTGLETILVLDGVQSDENGHYAAGSVVLNAEGTIHSVWSDGGCAVLIQWERPVEILTGEA